MTEAGTRAEHHLRGKGRVAGGGRGVVVAVLALILVTVVGLGADRPFWRIGGLPELVRPDSYAGDLVLIGFGLLAVGPIIVTMLRRRRGRRTADIEELTKPRVPIPWWGRVLAALAIAASVLLALLVIRFLPGSTADTRPARDATTNVVKQLPSAPATAHRPPFHWYGLAGLALVLLAGAAVAWRLRDAGGRDELEPEPDDDADDLVAAVDLSLEDIENEPDPRRAVIRAYARMERALGLHGLARQPFETPLEYLARALMSLRVGRRSVERLSALFERAKFSQHEIDGSMKAEALAALAALRDELAAAAA